jgi:hypothetical protein
MFSFDDILKIENLWNVKWQQLSLVNRRLLQNYALYKFEETFCRVYLFRA